VAGGEKKSKKEGSKGGVAAIKRGKSSRVGHNGLTTSLKEETTVRVQPAGRGWKRSRAAEKSIGGGTGKPRGWRKEGLLIGTNGRSGKTRAERLQKKG